VLGSGIDILSTHSAERQIFTLVSALTPELLQISVRVRGEYAVSTRTRWCDGAQENNHLRACVDLPKGPYELSCQDRTEHRMLLLSCLQPDSPPLLLWCTSCRAGLLTTPPQLYIAEVTAPGRAIVRFPHLVKVHLRMTYLRGPLALHKTHLVQG
jgi:hypothetical protein